VLALCVGPALAQTVAFSGRLGDKAVLVIDGTPRTLPTGASFKGVRLVGVDSDGAVVEIDGRRATLALGGAQVNLAAQGGPAAGTRIVLPAGTGGHFFADGSINGRAMQFIVDTGATSVTMGRSDAERAGVDWKRGQHALVQTANGVVSVHSVQLDTVRVGDVTLNNVEAKVLPTALPKVLLGNSFLSRFQMKRENDLLTLDRRF
jgi:aspartyl protease family protein